MSASFGKYFQQLVSFSLADIIKQITKTFEIAEKQEVEREGDISAQKLMLSKTDEEGAVARIRAKDMEARSLDEKRIIAIDVLLRPDSYGDISTKEVEEMQFDPLYTSELSKSDAERILRLPEKVSLALPFLHTNAEVNAHRLINKFYRGKDTSYFEREDYFSEGNYFEDESEIRDGNRVLSKRQIEDAESIHEILLREIRRDHIRARIGIGNLSVEEEDWLEIDRILNPEILFDDINEKTDTFSFLPPFALTSSILPTSVTKRTVAFGSPAYESTSPVLDGDRYIQVRSQTDRGESAFQSAKWRCPLSRQEILSLKEKVLDENASYDDRRVKFLMEKYYVSEDESYLGHQRLQMMKIITSEVRNILRKFEEQSLPAPTDVKEVFFDKDEPNTGVLRRLWGSWEQIHPASGGLTSQVEKFHRSSYSAARDHPAAYAVYSDPISRIDRLLRPPVPPGTDLYALGLSTLMATAGDATESIAFENDPRSTWYIVDSLEELASKDRQAIGGKQVLVTQKGKLTLLDVSDATLESRQSRSHHFSIQDLDSKRILDLTVSVVYQGIFGDRGYKLGRLAVSLFRHPQESDHSKSPLPHPVGYAPYDLICPNSPSTMGRVVIIHRPKVRPLRPGSFQIVIGVFNLRYTL